MNGGRQLGLTRRKLIAGFMGVTALVSSVAVASLPEKPPEETAPVGQTTTVQIPDNISVPGDSDVIRNVRVIVTCDANERCIINPVEQDPDADNYSFRLCPGGCTEIRDDTYTLQAGSTSDSGGELPVAKGFRRVSATTDEVVAVLATETINDNYYRATLGQDNGIAFDEVGEADMSVSVSYTGTSEAVSPIETDDGSDPLFAVVVIVTMLLVGALVLAGIGVAIKLLLMVFLGAASSGAARMTEDDDEDDDDEPDVDAPLALPQPITREVAEERAAVARDLLDRVRDIGDPRLSIQTGFSLLETGFGRVHLARRRNETSNAYIARVFGDHEELRPEMIEISRLFQRARFSDMPVDAEMRAAMIAKLESVQATWEREAFLLTEHVPAAPTGEAVRLHDEDDDLATHRANNDGQAL